MHLKEFTVKDVDAITLNIIIELSVVITPVISAQEKLRQEDSEVSLRSAPASMK
jgi:hypothetical protein